MKGIWTMRELVKLVLILMMAISMSACSKTTWKEEVLLHDGSKIIAERTVSRAGAHEIGQPPPIKEQSMSFTMPGNNGTVTWQDSFSEDIGGASFLAMLLDVSGDVAYVVATPMGCLAYNRWGRPNPPYVIFKYEKKEWRRIPLAELPGEIKTPNLISSAPDIEIKKLGVSLVSADFIKQWVSEYRQPEYKTILREPLIKQGPEGCREEIYNGHGTWLSRDWFTSQPSYEACINFCKTEDFSDQVCPCNSIFKRK